MPKITRISANTNSQPSIKSAKAKKVSKQLEPVDKKTTTEVKSGKSTAKPVKSCPLRKTWRVITWPFRLILSPFTAFGRYAKSSWQEIRQVRWPSRKDTWKMTGAIIAYTIVFMVFIVALDTILSFIFNQLIKK